MSARCARRSVLPDRGVDAVEVYPLVEPAADPIVASIGNKVRKAADVLVARLQPITPAHFHGAPLTLIREEPDKEPRQMIVQPPWYQGTVH